MIGSIKNYLQKIAKKAVIVSSVITAVVSLAFFYAYISLPSFSPQKANAQINLSGPRIICGVEVNASETSCSRSVTHYDVNFTLQSVDGKKHQVNFITFANYCTNGSASSCASNNGVEGSTSVTSSLANIPVSRSSSNGQACGTYQMDFTITSIDGQSSCHYGTGNVFGGNPGGAGICQTGVSCQNSCTPRTYNECEMGNSTYCHDNGGVPTGHIAQVTENNACGYSCKDLGPCVTPTPTPKPRPTATPTPKPTLTPIPTSTPFPSETPMPTATPTPTGTPFPTATPTPTGTPLPTLTPIPTNITTNNCDNSTQTGNNNANNNCNSNVNNNSNNNNQSQSQTQNNNQSVNVTVNNTTPTPEVLAASTTTPSQLPSTGSPVDTWVSLFGLLPIGFGLRKFALKK